MRVKEREPATTKRVPSFLFNEIIITIEEAS
jgi:hypothetical protein